MNQTKMDILASALRRIACGQSSSKPTDLAHIATVALADAAALVEYRITARTWYGRNGGEYRAELRNTDTGRTLIELRGSMWGGDAWAYDMRNEMGLRFPGVFGQHNGANPTIYFRDVAKVDYVHMEVSRKRDLTV